MNDIIYGIPSYRRSHITKTLDYLTSIGVPKERILLSLQNEIDEQEYRKKGFGSRATIIRCNGNYLSDNRNNILNFAQRRGVKRLLMLDDDIRNLQMKLPSKKYIIVGSEEILENIFSYCEKMNAPIWGGYFFKSPGMQKTIIRHRAIFPGVVFGFTDLSLRFTNDIVLKEDYELCLRVINAKRHAVRVDSLCAMTKQWGDTGGCEEYKNTTKTTEALQYLLKNTKDLFMRIRKDRGKS